MGIFDSIKRAIGSSVKKEASKVVTNAVRQGEAAIGRGRNSKETFTHGAHNPRR